MALSPFGLIAYEEDQDQGHILLNEWLLLFDWTTRGCPVEDVDGNDADAVSAADGKAWYVASAPATGDAWEGQAGKIAFYYAGWHFFTPSHGMRISVLDEKKVKVRNSAGAWENLNPSSTWT